MLRNLHSKSTWKGKIIRLIGLRWMFDDWLVKREEKKPDEKKQLNAETDKPSNANNEE